MILVKVKSLFQNGLMQLTKEDRNTFVLWLLILVLFIANCLTTQGGSVVFNYVAGAHRWLTGEDLYAGPEGYIYLPQFAFLFSFLPLQEDSAQIAWNLIQLSVMVSGLYVFSRLMARDGEKSFFPLLSVVVLIISLTTIRNGQATIMLLGLMLWSIVALTRKQWNLAALLLIIGLIIKPIFIVFFLLAVLFYHPLWWRLIIGLLIAFVVPMLFKGTGYTLSQYEGFITMASQAVEWGESGPKLNWAHFFAIFPQVFHVWVPASVQMAVRLIMAVATVFLVFYAHRRYSPEVACYYLYAFAACYLMLFNPRNETNSFALLSAAIGYWVVISKHRYSNLKYHAFCWLFVVSFPMAKYVKYITPGVWAWGKPVIALLFTIFLIQRLFSGEMISSKNQSLSKE